MSMSTCDLCDRFGALARVPDVVWRDYGARRVFDGPVATVRCFEDNSRIKELSGQPGEGRVLVIEGGASLSCALVGDMIAGDLARNGWVGVIVWGAVRDVEVLATLDFGVKALGASPRRSVRRGEGQLGSSLSLGGVDCSPGDHVYADLNGVVLLPSGTKVADLG